MSEAVLPSVAAGESGAAEQCLERYGPLVWGIARKYFARRADAEDATQEAFLALWEHAGRFDPAVASEPTFVAMIARRRMIDVVRRATAARRSASTETGFAEPALPVEEVEGRRAPSLWCDGVALGGLEIAEEARRVRLQMERLSEDQRRVLELAIVEGHSQAEIAESTGLPLGTVKSHARRGLRRLRELLAEAESPVPSAQEAER